MIKNYFKMAWRSLIKNKVSSFINIGGLSIGLATAIVIMLVIVNYHFSHRLFIVISCLGLFGLSIFLAERRSKKLSVRKVLGASVKSIWFTLSKDFLKPVFIAFIIAAPLAGLVLQKALSLMDYHIQLAWWMFVLAGVLAILVALITVSFNGIKAALENPIKSLRSE